MLSLHPKAHFADLDEARALANNFVRAYEISGGLELGCRGFRFRFRIQSMLAKGTDRKSGEPVDLIVAVLQVVAGPYVLDATCPCAPGAASRVEYVGSAFAGGPWEGIALWAREAHVPPVEPVNYSAAARGWVAEWFRAAVLKLENAENRGLQPGPPK